MYWKVINSQRRKKNCKTVFTIVRFDSLYYQKAVVLRNDIFKSSAGQPFIMESPINDIHLVVKWAGVTVGTLLMARCSSNCIQARQVAIHRDYQRKSLGKS